MPSTRAFRAAQPNSFSLFTRPTKAKMLKFIVVFLACLNGVCIRTRLAQQTDERKPYSAGKKDQGLKLDDDFRNSLENVPSVVLHSEDVKETQTDELFVSDSTHDAPISSSVPVPHMLQESDNRKAVQTDGFARLSEQIEKSGWFHKDDVDKFLRFEVDEQEYRVEKFRVGQDHSADAGYVSAMAFVRRSDGNQFPLKLFRSHYKSNGTSDFDHWRKNIFANMLEIRNRNLDGTHFERLADGAAKAGAPLYFSDFWGNKDGIMGILVDPNGCTNDITGESSDTLELEDMKALSLLERKSMTRQVDEMLKSLEQKRILHLDLHYQNVMVCAARRKESKELDAANSWVYVLDWKSAVFFDLPKNECAVYSESKQCDDVQSSLDNSLPSSLSYDSEDTSINRLIRERQPYLVYLSEKEKGQGLHWNNLLDGKLPVCWNNLRNWMRDSVMLTWMVEDRKFVGYEKDDD